jgi:RHS repeat-associated protein
MKHQYTLTACNYSYIQLIDFNARFYSPALGRFIQPDTVIPNPANPQSLNHFSYAYNNPLNYIDPSGHIPTGKDETDVCLPSQECWEKNGYGGGNEDSIHIDPMFDPWVSGYKFGEEKEFDTCLDYSGENFETCYHPGVDEASEYLMVVAPATGKIYFMAYMNPGFGNYIILEEDTGNGEANYYILAHLKDSNTYNIPQGSMVDVGTPIGVMGESGTKGGIHLHYEIQHHNTNNFTIQFDGNGNLTSYSVNEPTLGNYHKFYPRYQHQLDTYWIDPTTWSNTEWSSPRKPFAVTP